MPKLTKRLIDALQTDDDEAFVWDTVVLGFGVRVRRSGTKSFILKYRMGSAVRRHTLGRVGSPHTVEEARDAASEMLRQVKAGHDPMQAKRASNEAITVNELIQAYLHEGRIAKPNKRESSWAGDASVLNRHVSPLLGHRLARDLTRRDLEKLQADVLTGKTAKDVRTKSRGRAIIRGGPGAAGHTIRTTAAMLSWAVMQDILPFNPAFGVQKITARRRERFLTTAEAKHMLTTLSVLVTKEEIPESHAAIIRPPPVYRRPKVRDPESDMGGGRSGARPHPSALASIQDGGEDDPADLGRRRGNHAAPEKWIVRVSGRAR
nr:Arm DNA-binding domain-containing protein [uncultured Brevundimonas sp.]